MASSPINPGTGIDIVVTDGVATTISPKLKAIATDAETAEQNLTKLQGALARITAGNLTSVSQAASGMSRSVNNSANAISKLSDAAVKAEGNLQRLVQQMTVVTFAANQMTTAFQNTNIATNATVGAVNSVTAATTRGAAGLNGFGGSTRLASAELSVLRGNMTGSTRSAGLFLTQMLGLGPAMAAAFPVFGALAVVGVLVTMIGKVAELIQNWGALKKIQDDATKSMLDSEDKQIQLQQEMLRNTRELRVNAAEATGSHAGQAQRGRAAGAAFDIGQDIVAIKNAQDELKNRSQTLINAQQAIFRGDKNSDVTQAQLPKLQAERDTAQTAVDAAARQLEVDKATESLAKQNDRYTEGKAAMEAYKQAQEKIIQGWREQAAMIADFSDNATQDVLSFWTMAGVQAKQGSISQQKAFSEMLTAERAYTREIQRDTKERQDSFESAGAAIVGADTREQGKQSLDQIHKYVQALTQLGTALTEYRQTQINVNETNAINAAQTNQQLGYISAQTAAQDIYNAKLAAYNAQLKEIGEARDQAQRRGDLAGAITLGGQASQLESQKQGLENQNRLANPENMGDVIRRSLAGFNSSYQGPLQQMQHDFTKAFATIGDGFADTVAHSIVYATSFTAALKNVAREGLQEIISGLIKIGIQQVIQAALAKTIQAGSQAASATLGASTAAAWAPAAAMVSLATFGANGVAADAAVSTTTGLTESLSAVSFAGSFAKGGLIGGYGGPTSDSNVILASRGEYVVNAQSTAQHYALLSAINSGAQVAKSNVLASGAGASRMHVTVEDHTLGGTTFQVNHMDDNTVRVIARQEIQNNTDGHVASAVANPNSKTSKALGVHTAATRRRNG